MGTQGRIEWHPHEAFVPTRVRCLVVGSFPGRDMTLSPGPEDWFYGTRRNQFWQIMELAYQRKLDSKNARQALCEEAGIAFADIIRSCVRTAGNNLDENLEIIEWNDDVITPVLESWQPLVLFTSRFVEKLFRQKFPYYTNTDVLPSPSPRYFRLRVEDKAAIYKEKLPPV
ncbi:MAG TPA: hypothetical protein VFZ78_02095 [Flavisolibacter sp.]